MLEGNSFGCEERKLVFENSEYDLSSHLKQVEF